MDERMKNLNLVEILKNCPEGTKLYSPLYGDVELVKVDNDGNFPILVRLSNNAIESFTKDGRMFIDYDGECMLFPSKEQRDWSKFKVEKPKFDPKTLKPFDRVLVRDFHVYTWKCALYSHMVEIENSSYRHVTTDSVYICCIPYNNDTKHLIGTKKEAPEYYRYWEE